MCLTIPVGTHVQFRSTDQKALLRAGALYFDRIYILDPDKGVGTPSGRKSHGVILRFAEEDRSGKERNWSGYAFVSREGIGEWEEFRPRLLVVEAARKAPSE